jgi:hypothetical protein
MKTNKSLKNKVAELTAIGMMAGMMSITTAHAQDRGGNGGKGFIGQFEFNVEQIQGWLERGNLNKVDLSSITPAIDSQKLASDVISTTKKVLDHSIKLEFVDSELKVGEEVRTCLNFKAVNLIQCNNARWKDAETPESRYMLTMHELISIAGYENNDGVSSEYKISRKILPYVAPSSTYVLVDDQQTKNYPGIQCEIDDPGTKLRKARRMIIQANELEARVLFSDVVAPLSGESIWDKVRGYDYAYGLQQAYPLSKKYDNGKSFLNVATDSRFGDFKMKLKDGTVMSIWAGMYKSNPSPYFHVYIGTEEDPEQYVVTDKGYCTFVDFQDDQGYSAGTFGTMGIHYETNFAIMPERRAELLNSSVKWLKSLAHKKGKK